MPVIDNSSGTRTDCYRIMSLNQYEENNKEKYVCDKVSRILPAIALFPLSGTRQAITEFCPLNL